MLRVGAATILLAFLMFAVVIALRLRLVLRQRRERDFIGRWRLLFAQCTEAVPEGPPRLLRRHHDLFLKLWNHYFESLRGGARENLRLLAIRSAIDAVARRRLETGGLRERLMAATTLGHLRDQGSAERLRPLVSDPSPPLSLAAARALLEIDRVGTLGWLPAVIAARTDWSLPKVAGMLGEAEADFTTQPLAAAAEAAAATEHAPEHVPRLLRLIEATHAERVSAVIGRILQRSQHEEVIAACLGALRDPRDIEIIRARTAHPHWLVRMAAARALGRLGTPDDLTRLVGLLGDTHWWVRYHAAHALAALPFVTDGDLRRMRSEISDRYGIDMLAQTIAERS